jgi:hypothetical protein
MLRLLVESSSSKQQLFNWSADLLLRLFLTGEPFFYAKTLTKIEVGWMISVLAVS